MLKNKTFRWNLKIRCTISLINQLFLKALSWLRVKAEVDITYFCDPQ